MIIFQGYQPLKYCFSLQQHTHKLNTQVALHQLYQYASKYYDVVRRVLLFYYRYNPWIDNSPTHLLPPRSLNVGCTSCFLQIIQSLDEDPAAQTKQLTVRLQQIAAALENKVTDL